LSSSGYEPEAGRVGCKKKKNRDRKSRGTVPLNKQVEQVSAGNIGIPKIAGDIVLIYVFFVDNMNNGSRPGHP
jgi:hypothetical protein